MPSPAFTSMPNAEHPAATALRRLLQLSPDPSDIPPEVLVASFAPGMVEQLGAKQLGRLVASFASSEVAALDELLTQ